MPTRGRRRGGGSKDSASDAQARWATRVATQIEEQRRQEQQRHQQQLDAWRQQSEDWIKTAASTGFFDTQYDDTQHEDTQYEDTRDNNTQRGQTHRETTTDNSSELGYFIQDNGADPDQFLEGTAAAHPAVHRPICGGIPPHTAIAATAGAGRAYAIVSVVVKLR